MSTAVPPAAGVTIRPLESYADLEQCVDLQRATWGEDNREIVPPAVMLVVQKVGGIALGAFEPAGALIGTLFGITGVVDDQPVHWSHMLAVRTDWRDRGVGQLLKAEQRRLVVAMGVRRIRWTFDPLVARNAHVNLHRLGVHALEYVADMYGASASSITDSVIGSDRLVVEWRPLEPAPTRPAADEAWPRLALEAGVDQALPEAAGIRLEIPRDIQALKRTDPERAVAWRHLTHRAFEHFLALGYRIADFQRGHVGSRGWYVLVRPPAAR